MKRWRLKLRTTGRCYPPGVPAPLSPPAQTDGLARHRLLLAAIGGGSLLAGLEGSIANAVLPIVTRELQTDVSTAEWILTEFLLVQTSVMLMAGRLGDLRGQRPVYLSGFAVFAAGSALCGVAPGIYWLIGARMLQASGRRSSITWGCTHSRFWRAST